MIIRSFIPDDTDAIIEVFRSNIPKYFGSIEEPGLRTFLADARSEEYFVVEIDDDVIGAGGIASNEDGTVSLCWGMIREDHLGTGLGKTLTSFRLNAANQRFPGAPVVISTSQHTQGFYEKFGFRLTEHTANGFGEGIDICKMRLEQNRTWAV